MKFSARGLLARAGIVGILCLVWYAFVRNLLGSDHSFAIYRDNESFLAPVLAHMSARIQNGEWPLWMNTILGGIPLYNFTQFSPLYPFYFVGFPIFGTTLDAIRSMHLITIWHILLFEVNAYLLLRTLRVSRIASVAGAVLVVFNANTLGYAVWINIIAPYGWFPLYLVGLLRLLDAPASRRAFVMTLSAIVMLALASPAQPLIHAVFVTIVFVVFHVLRLQRAGDTIRLQKGLLGLCGVAVIAVLLASPVLIPSVIEFKDMIRWVGPFPPVYGNERIPFDAFLTDQLAIRDFPGVFFRLGDIRRAVGSEFIGILPIALAIFACLSKERHRAVWPLAFIAIYSLASAFGSNLGFAYINYHLPLINQIREPSRFLFLFHFAVGILAAIGIDKLGRMLEQSGAKPPDYRGLWRMCGVVVVGLFVAIMYWQQFGRHLVTLIPVIVLTLLMVATTLAATRKQSSRSKWFVAVWAIAVIAVQWLLVPWAAPPISSSDYLREGMVSLDAVLARVAEKDTQHEYRVIFDGNIDKQQAAMLASYHGLRTLNAYFNPAPRKQFEELYYHGPRKDNYFRVLGAKYLICQKCDTEATFGYTFIEEVAGYSIYETSAALPHTYIVYDVDGEFRDLGEVNTKMSSMDLLRPPLLVEPGAWMPDPGRQGKEPSGCLQRTSHHALNKIGIVILCDSSGVFVLNEFFSTAWNATVDGKKIEKLRVNGNQMGVPFSAGSHLIEFRYAPQNFQISLLLVFSGGVVLLLVLFLMRGIESKRYCETRSDSPGGYA